eukprot:TRINITY_DN54974_c0_g1_i1.p1 TRINITY_DN54974_c0_g1~~TRINITY_DN54974_c0_g1_i1.p1  ORF type:complete len:756 (-),score=209.32 TRINITY_DN54974_c0_g1_i1:46-2214(-)
MVKNGNDKKGAAKETEMEEKRQAASAARAKNSAKLKANGGSPHAEDDAVEDDRGKKKKQQKSGPKDDFSLLDGEEKAARNQRVLDRFLRMMVVGFFLDKNGQNGSGSAADGGSKKGTKKNSRDSKTEARSWDVGSLRSKADQYFGPIMMVLVLVALVLARVSEENFSFDHSLEFEDNYYDLLALPRDASVPAIRKAYKAVALSWHPDKNPDCETCAEKFAKISKAYDVLIDPDKRKAYDQKRAPQDSLESRTSVELTAENFEYTVLRSNEAWIVQVYDPSDGGPSKGFHSTWEDVTMKAQGTVKFGRIDITKQKKALEFLPQRVVVTPQVWRFARGQEPEQFSRAQMMREEGSRPFMNFVSESFPAVSTLKTAAELKQWWAQEDPLRPRVLLTSSQALSRAPLLKVQRVSHLWGDFARFAQATAAVAADVLGDAAVAPQRGAAGPWVVYSATNGSTAASRPTASEPSDTERLPEVMQEAIARLAQMQVPLLTVRNYQQLCGTGQRLARTYCLLLVDDDSAGASKALSELEASRAAYAQELADSAVPDDEKIEDEDAAPSSDAIDIQAVRVSTRTSRFPWVPPAAGPHFGSIWAEVKYSPMFLLELETRRVSEVKAKSLGNLYQQVAYDDIKLRELPEAVSILAAMPDAEASFRREFMAMLKTPLGTLVAYLFSAAVFAVAPELSLPMAGSLGAAVLSVFVVAYPPACRRFLALAVGGANAQF